MSAMAFREPNQVKWVGIRPGHNGSQVFKYASATNGVTIVHTVTAGKTLYLVTASIMSLSNQASNGFIGVRNGADVDQGYLCHVIGAALGGYPSPLWYSMPPLELPAGWDVYVQSGAAGFTAIGTIFGWEE